MGSTPLRTTMTVVLLGLLLTGMVTVRLHRAAQEEQAERVRQATETLRAQVTAQMHGLETGLLTLRDTIAVTTPGDPEASQVLHRWPVDGETVSRVIALGQDSGAIGASAAVALFRTVPAVDRAAYEAQAGEVHPASVRTSGHAYVIESVQPLHGNEAVLGYDLASEHRRRAAVERSRDFGTPAMTGPVRLAQGTAETGVIIVVPVYGSSTIPDTVAGRRAGHVGGLSAAVHPGQLLQTPLIAGLHLDAALLDAGAVTGQSVLSARGGELLASTVRPDPGSSSVSQLFGPGREVTRTDIVVADRRWRLLTAPTPAFGGVTMWPVVAWTLCGLAATALLGILTALLQTRERRAQRLVQERTVELTRSESALREAYEAVQENDAQKTRFLVTVSHELRTPLTTIRGFASLLEGHGDALAPEDRASFLGQLSRSVEGLSELVQEVLDFAELEAFHGARPAVDIDVNALVQRVVDGQPSTHDLVVIPLPAAVGAGDPQALSQALTNVLANARAYAPAGTRVGVWVRAGSSGDLEVVVDDQGPGIPPEERHRVFNRFYRGDAAVAGTVPGTGIGLTVARRLLEDMGGRIGVEHAPGGGARFILTLPCAGSRAAHVDAVLETSG